MTVQSPAPSPHSFERLLTRLSAQLAAAPMATVDEVIVSAQNAIIRFLDLDRSTLFQFDDGYSAARTHTAERSGFSPVVLSLPHLALPWIASQIRAGNVVQFTSVDELPPEAAVDRETIGRVGPKSNVTFPLIAGGSVFGALAFGVMREERRWPRAVVRRLGLLAEIIANTLYRKRADEALRRSEARMNLALTSAGVGLWSREVGADTYWASDQLRLLYGLAADSTLSASAFDDMIHEQDRETVRLALEASLAERSEFHTEFRILRPDGQMRWIACRGRHVVDGFEASSRLVGVSYDITARVRAEESERRARADLAHVARTVTLGELSASLAHELNQPLAAILSNAQAGVRLLRFDSPDVREACAALEDIVDDAKRAGEVIRRVRELVRKGTPETSLVDLQALIGDVVSLLHSDAVHRRVRVESRLAPVPRVQVDRVQVQQVLMNLMLNAFEAFPAEQGEREVRVVLDRDGSWARVTVLDNGPGLSADAHAHLFQPFHSTKPQGLGIGLSLCRSIIEAHGGWIGAHNRNEGGASAQFTLPVIEDPSQAS